MKAPIFLLVLVQIHLGRLGVDWSTAVAVEHASSNFLANKARLDYKNALKLLTPKVSGVSVDGEDLQSYFC